MNDASHHHQNRMLTSPWYSKDIRSDEAAEEPSSDAGGKASGESSLSHMREKTLVSPDVQNHVSFEISNASISDLSCAGTRGFPSPVGCVRTAQPDFPLHADCKGMIRVETLAPADNVGAAASTAFEDKSVQTEPFEPNPPITSQHSHPACTDNITITRRRRTRSIAPYSGNRSSSRAESRADDDAPLGSEWSSACPSFLHYASTERLPRDPLRPQLSCSRGFRRRRPLPGTRPAPVPRPQAAAGPEGAWGGAEPRRHATLISGSRGLGADAVATCPYATPSRNDSEVGGPGPGCGAADEAVDGAAAGRPEQGPRRARACRPGHPASEPC